jgi:hypothetical protein
MLFQETCIVNLKLTFFQDKGKVDVHYMLERSLHENIKLNLKAKKGISLDNRKVTKKMYK